MNDRGHRNSTFEGSNELYQWILLSEVSTAYGMAMDGNGGFEKKN